MGSCLCCVGFFTSLGKSRRIGLSVSELAAVLLYALVHCKSSEFIVWKDILTHGVGVDCMRSGRTACSRDSEICLCLLQPRIAVGTLCPSGTCHL